jgi:hypothetical protein
MTDHKFDVALSFLARDIEVARAICNAISPSLRVFLYERNQEEVAGTDGMESFRAVFRHDAALNVVLYRDGYGETRWTRVELTAIQERALEDGWQTVLVAALESHAKAPKWLPQSRIFASIAEFGVGGVSAVILARARELGLQERTESPVELAARLHREGRDADRRSSVERSTWGVTAAETEADRIFQRIKTLLGEVAASAVGERVLCGMNSRFLGAQVRNHGVLVNWHVHYSNALDDACLTYVIKQGIVPVPGHPGRAGYAPTDVLDCELVPHLAVGDRWVWHDSSSSRQFGSDELADFIVSELVRIAFAR